MRIVDEIASALESRLAGIAATISGGALGVGVHDLLSGCSWHHDGERWFHAASTIKVAVLAAVFDAIDAGRFSAESRVHVRNRFFSAIDGQPFRVHASRDADGDVHAAIGRTMRIAELTRHMIGTSSNLATNLLLDVIGLDEAKRALAARGVTGIDLQRGVEDDRAFEAGCSNRVTANGLVSLLRAIRDVDRFSPASVDAMTEILFDQRFAGSIGPGLPDAVRAVARVAHKTGDISTISHDAGLVFLPGRPPYAVALLAESPGDGGERTAALAAASRAVYDAVAAAGESACR
jgi:beta-lactamase class A